MDPIDYSAVFHNSLRNISCAAIVVEYLKLEGVRYIFGIPGGTVVPLLTAIENEPEIDFILARHEGGAAFMADMYARSSGKLGVCLSTAGPGATNMLTGVACAHRDGVPLLAITGQPATHTLGKGAIQESSGFGIDIVRIYEETCGFSAMVSEPDVLRQMVTTALRVALGNHKQAVHLSFPSNISSFVFENYEMPTDTRKYRIRNMAFDPARLNDAASLLLKASKPAILLGSGIKSERAQIGIREMAETLQCPVLTSPQGKGTFPEDHSLSLGVFGFAGSVQAKKYLLGEDVDLLVVIGSRLDEWTTNSWDSRITPERYLIQIDSDCLNIGKNFPVSLGVIGDIDKIIFELKNLVKHNSTKKAWKKIVLERKVDLAEFKSRIGAFLAKEKRDDDSTPVKPQRLFKEINRILKRDTIVISDAGNSYAWSLHHLKIVPPQKYLVGLGFASMGHAVAGAPGAKLANPDQNIVVFCGDGSFLMNGNEIHTAVQYSIPVLWIILNDNSLGMVYHGMKVLTGAPIMSEFNAPLDFAKIARSFGAEGIRVESSDEIQSAFESLLCSKRPAVLDVVIDKDEEPPFLERIKGLKKYNQ